MFIEIFCPSHVTFSQSFVDRQQARDLLDDDFSRQFDGPVSKVASLALCFEAPGFLMGKRTERETDR